MGFRNYRAEIALRLAALTASIGLFFFIAYWTSHLFTAIIVAAACLGQAFLLFAALAGRDRLWADFFAAVNASERAPSVRLPASRALDSLRLEYEALRRALRDGRLEGERRYRYLRAIADSIDIGLLVLGEGGRVDFHNAAFGAVFGRPGEDGPIESGLASRLMGMRDGEKELAAVRPGGSGPPLLVSVRDFAILGEKLRLASFQDIQKELDETELDAWGKMARVLTHEIMNSLAPISSLASTSRGLLAASLEGSPPDSEESARSREDLGRALAAIERRGKGLAAFVEGYRRILGVPRPRKAPIPCRELAAKAVELLRPELEERGIALSCESFPERLEVEADAQLVEQVLINLVHNAIDALEGVPDPQLRIESRLEGLGRIAVSVRDNGRGIAAEALDKVFVPFYTTKAGGSGIGLSFCRQVMSLHGGSIAVESAPGAGTSFTLLF